MNINDLFDNIVNIFNQFIEEIIAEQAHKCKSTTEPGPESKGKDSENSEVRVNQIDVDFPKRE
jgi:hypothetical protein